MASDVRVRFAPSPTGKLHIGGARTAIYNWAFARANGGTFILRIDDTDPTRSTDENTQIILRAMRWLGLDWDEGPEVGGDFGPYAQTERLDLYKQAAQQLWDEGKAYPCFCTKEQLEADRKAAQERKDPFQGYQRRCRELDPEEARRRIEAGEPYVLRIKVPEDRGDVVIHDAVHGEVTFDAKELDDFVIFRSDGTPTYNFATVVDDAMMKITHVIRGDDHLSNTPRQVMVYEALGAPVPTFAHISMILGADGKKLSKRHGATNVEEYRDRGYLSDSLVNFLALLGWSLDGETTIIDRETLCREFSLDRVTKKDAVFDETKLDWMNGVYIREMGAHAWADAALPWLVDAAAFASKAGDEAARIVATPNPSDPNAPQPDPIVITDVDRAAVRDAIDDLAHDGEPSTIERMYPLVAERLARLDEIPAKLEFLFWGPQVRLDEKSVKKVLQKESARPAEALDACRSVLADESIAWEAAALETACRAAGDKLEMKVKNLLQPLRVAVCGNMVSPPLFESIELMKREDVLARIDATRALVYGA